MVRLHFLFKNMARSVETRQWPLPAIGLFAMPKKRTTAGTTILPVSPFYRAVFQINSRAAGLPRGREYKALDEYGRSSTGFVMARHYCKTPDNPYRIPNEFICARLGTAIGLPIPPFALARISDGGRKLLFSSLDFNPSGLRSPPIDAEMCLRHLEPLCVGVLVFDVWVANTDRNETNLAVDKPGLPRVMRVFDHDHALFGGWASLEKGRSRLLSLANRIGVTESTSTSGTPHVLLEHLKTDNFMQSWVERVRDIPHWMIYDACTAMYKKGLTALEVNDAIKFLRRRQSMLPSLIDDLCRERGIPITPRAKNLFDQENK